MLCFLFGGRRGTWNLDLSCLRHGFGPIAGTCGTGLRCRWTCTTTSTAMRCTTPQTPCFALWPVERPGPTHPNILFLHFFIYLFWRKMHYFIDRVLLFLIYNDSDKNIAKQSVKRNTRPPSVWRPPNIWWWYNWFGRPPPGILCVVFSFKFH